MWKIGWRLIQRINCFKTRQFHANEKEACRLYFGLVVTAELEMSNWYDSLLVFPLSFIEYLRAMQSRISARKIMLYVSVMIWRIQFSVSVSLIIDMMWRLPPPEIRHLTTQSLVLPNFSPSPTRVNSFAAILSICQPNSLIYNILWVSSVNLLFYKRSTCSKYICTYTKIHIDLFIYLGKSHFCILLLILQSILSHLFIMIVT